MRLVLVLAVVVALASCVLADKVDYQCTSDSDCLSCEACESNQCVNDCSLGEECIEVAYGGVGECQAICDADACETFDAESQTCVSTCVGCESCDGQGACQADESLRNDCLKCPGDEGYDNCCSYDKPVAFEGHLTFGPNNTNLALAVTELHCRTLDIENERRTCTTDAQCRDCDTCTVDTCDAGTCVHTPVADAPMEPGMTLKCGMCSAFTSGPDGRCDDGNADTFDSCEMGRCKHLIKYGK